MPGIMSERPQSMGDGQVTRRPRNLRRLKEDDFKYDRLEPEAKQIRLTSDVCRNKDGEITCRLQPYPMDSAPSYTAVSYTWGNIANPNPCYILANGKILGVGKNLWRFLLQMTTRKRQSFWIDAICIDQGGTAEATAERNTQVAMMAETFGQAQQVYSWLGPSYSNSKRAFADLCRGDKAAFQKLWWEPISRVLNRAYWTRLWILQELVLAREVVPLCGDQEVSWECFTAFMDQATLEVPPASTTPKQDYELSMSSQAASLIAQFALARSSSSLVEQMRRSHRLGCVDGRDKVYALLGIVTAGHEAIDPDYNRSLPDLLNHVLRNSWDIDPPEDMTAVKSRCVELARLANVPESTILSDFQWPATEWEDIILPETDIKLSWVAYYGHQSISKIFGSAIDATFLEMCILEAAAGEGQIGLVQFLMDLGCVGVEWRTRSCLPRRRSHDDVTDMTIGHLAVIYNNSRMLRSFLHSCSEAINNVDSMRRTVLQLAIEYGAVRFVEQLLDAAGATAFVHDAHAIKGMQTSFLHSDPEKLKTALQKAAKFGMVQVAKVAHEAGGFYCGWGQLSLRRALCAAVRNSDTDLVRVLLSFGTSCSGSDCWPHCQSNSCKENASSLQPLELAAEEGKELLTQLILQDHRWATSNASERALHEAIRNGHEAIVRLLLDLEDVHAVAKEECEFAVSRRNLRMVQVFLDCKAFNVGSMDSYTWLDQMMITCDTQCRNLFELLLGCDRVDVNARPMHVKSTLMRSVEEEDGRYMELLLSHKDIDVNAIKGELEKSAYCCTALDVLFEIYEMAKAGIDRSDPYDYLHWLFEDNEFHRRVEKLRQAGACTYEELLKARKIFSPVGALTDSYSLGSVPMTRYPDTANALME